MPADRARLSANACSGLWHEAHASSPLRDRRLSKNSRRPRTTPPAVIRSSDLTRTTLGVLFIGALIAASFWILRPFLGAIVWALPEPEFYRYLQRIVEAGFGNRVMFGSDQMVWPGVIGLGWLSLLIARSAWEPLFVWVMMLFVVIGSLTGEVTIAVLTKSWTEGLTVPTIVSVTVSPASRLRALCGSRRIAGDGSGRRRASVAGGARRWRRGAAGPPGRRAPCR